jgi:hypothetical protein
MSNYPQDKFTAPSISGKWKYWSNFQSITPDGISEIKKFNGIIDISQDNLFFNYVNKELNLNRIGVFVQNSNCVNGKTNIQWEAKVVNNTDGGTISLYPYCYKKGKPTKMINATTAPGPVQSTNPTFVRTTYYEKI